MPKKIRELIADLEHAGFARIPGKGSHRKFRKGSTTIVISGNPGDDAKKYQERDVQGAVGENS